MDNHQLVPKEVANAVSDAFSKYREAIISFFKSVVMDKNAEGSDESINELKEAVHDFLECTEPLHRLTLKWNINKAIWSQRKITVVLPNETIHAEKIAKDKVARYLFDVEEWIELYGHEDARDRRNSWKYHEQLYKDDPDRPDPIDSFFWTYVFDLRSEETSYSKKEIEDEISLLLREEHSALISKIGEILNKIDEWKITVLAWEEFDTKSARGDFFLEKHQELSTISSLPVYDWKNCCFPDAAAE